jgi:GAF domain-containing protein
MLPISLRRLLDAFAGCFTTPTFEVFRAMVVGLVAQTGQRTVCGMLIDYQPDTVPDRARQDGVAVRVDDYTHEPDARLAVEYNMTAAVSAPIFVGGQVWGMLTATSDSRPLVAGTEQRLLQFTGLITAAVANTQTLILKLARNAIATGGRAGGRGSQQRRASQ